VTFTVTKTPKPTRPENPVEIASIFADNGDGRANRVEIYFRDPLEYTPDSIHIAWPSLLQRFNFTENSIARDESNKRHLTVKLGKTFPIKTTGIIGADYLGTWYSTDTSYAKPFAAVRFKIADSIGALITEALWYERTGSEPDTFLLSFSEPIDHSLLTGKSVQLINRDTKMTLTVLKYELQGNNVKIVTENTGYNVEVGDSLRFNPDGPVRDKHGNKPHPQNLPALITIRERPPLIKHAFYQDKNADGTIDHVVLEFDKSIAVSEIKGTFNINKIKFSVTKADKISYSGDNRSKVIFDLSNSVPKEMNGITTGTMNVQVVYNKFPGIEITNSVQDSAAPVLMRALFSEGLSEINTETDTPDTLQITFSEEVHPLLPLNRLFTKQVIQK
jgi:hypothetical protein